MTNNGDREHLQPMMQQLPSFLLFCCCDDYSISTILKPSYVSECMHKGTKKYFVQHGVSNLSIY